MLHVVVPLKHAKEAMENVQRQDYKDILVHHIAVPSHITVGTLINDVLRGLEGYATIYEPGCVWATDRISRQMTSIHLATALKRITIDNGKREGYFSNARGLVLETLIYKLNNLVPITIPDLDCGFRLNILQQLQQVTVLDEPHLYRRHVSQI